VSTGESTLVVSAHAADFGGRAGGAIALAEAYMRVFPQVTDRIA
jgi:hypothetical protein